MASDERLSETEYQSLPHVAWRVRQFCGLLPDASSGCRYLATMGAGDPPHTTWGHVAPHRPEELPEILASGADLARSLWDAGNLLIYVDLDYLNPDAPGEAYVDPAGCFLKLEPAYRRLVDVLDELGVPLLDLATGAGYGFVGQVRLGGLATKRLARLAPHAPPWYASHAVRRPPWISAIAEEEARAHCGLGMALEHLAHRVLSLRAPANRVPLILNNTEVGGSAEGRACVSLDLTHMGDPLDTRHLRVAFGLYQKHRLRPDLVGEAAGWLAPLVVLPRLRRSLLRFLEGGRGMSAGRRDAAWHSASIPDVEEGMLRLLDDYEGSRLAAWHREFHGVQPHPPEQWHATYDRYEPAELPPCVSASLEWPNDLLLKPARIQLLVRTLLARGWHARHIAGLVWSRYARPGIWGQHWRRIDPATRADYDVRVFAGLVATGLDQGMDFNCVSTQERGLCPGTTCGHDLRRDRERLLARASS